MLALPPKDVFLFFNDATDRGFAQAAADARTSFSGTKLDSTAVQNSLVIPAERSLLLRSLILTQWRRTNMKKLGYVIAALGAIAIAAPSIASA